jgi:hypothetical protein
VYGAALFSAATVGLVVAVRQRRHPVGWLFLALGVALSVGGAGGAHALDRGVVHGDTSAMTGLALVAGQASFIAWFGLLAFIVHLTPTGRPLSPRCGRAMTSTTSSEGGDGHPPVPRPGGGVGLRSSESAVPMLQEMLDRG